MILFCMLCSDSRACGVVCRNLVTQAGKSMRSNFAKEGAKIISDATQFVDGLGQQVNDAFSPFLVEKLPRGKENLEL